jgi:hypothetical protein
MVRTPVLAVAGGAALIILGLVLATVSSPLGTVITVVGIVLLAAFLIFAFRTAWSGDQKRAWNPGSLRREYRDEQAAKRK